MKCCHRAGQPEPMAGAEVALGNRQETCQRCLGSEHVITILVESRLGDAVADRHEIALRIREQVEFHIHREFSRVGRDGFQPVAYQCYRRGIEGGVLELAFNGLPQHDGPA